MPSSTSVLDRYTALTIAGSFAHVVYGEDRLPSSYRGKSDNGLDDAYDSFLGLQGWSVLKLPLSGSGASYAAGGLYSGDTGGGDYDAQALVAETVLADGTKVVTLSFRGTDDNTNAVLGQAFTKNGLQGYYDGFEPLIDAVIAYVNKSSNGVDALVVTGHSLGGSMVDTFMMQDAARVSNKVDLEAIAVGSAGLVSSMVKNVDLSDYTLLANDGDLVVYPGLESWWVPTAVLSRNEHPDGTVLTFEMQNLDRLDDVTNWWSTDYIVGLQHESKLYYENTLALTTDPLNGFFSGNLVIMGNGSDADGDNVEATGTDSDDPSANDNGSAALKGTGDADYIIGREGNDELLGFGGDDLLSGGAGNDTAKGGTGYDKLHGGVGQDDLSGEGGNDRLWGGAGDDTLSGSVGNDTLDGGTGADKLYAGGGNDRAFGGDGNDLLRGGGGLDWLWGDDGNDTLYGDTGADKLRGGTGADQLHGGAGSDNITGGGGDDRLFGDGENDFMQGSGGNDSVYGGAGNDRLRGDAGNDVLRGGDGADKLFGGNGRDSLSGDTGADLLRGEAGADVLRGGAYHDTLVGGYGNDLLIGGTGRDVFVFAENHGRDVVRDFEIGMDRIRFDGLSSSDLSLSYKGDDTVIKGDGLEVILRDVHLDELSQSDLFYN